MIKVKIKRGAKIFQDMGFFRWPGCRPPKSEYENESEYDYETRHPDAIFTAEWKVDHDKKDGGYWDCRRDGYGIFKPNGEYGNGSIFVYEKDGVEILDAEAGKGDGG